MAGPVMPVVAIATVVEKVQDLIGFFEAVPPDSGAAFIVAVHPASDDNGLAARLAQYTPMPVHATQDGMRITPNHVYISAAGRALTLDGDILRLPSPPVSGGSHPAGPLLESLAAQQRPLIAVMLEGAQHACPSGLRSVKACGGLVMAQAAATERCMAPGPAAGSATPDIVAPLRALPALVAEQLSRAAPADLANPGAMRGELEQLYDILHEATGREYRTYKIATVWRRIARRMHLKAVPHLRQYLDLLRTEPGEARALASDLLITVTSFFRDPQAWQSFARDAVAPLIAARPSGAAIRAWVPACATGEEAYSVAMLLVEQAEAAQKRFAIKIFASDVLDDNLHIARAGTYPAASVAAIAPDRLSRFFDVTEHGYQVKKSLRDLLIFTRHDLLEDPPLSRMDLLTCRNVLIYLEPEAQRRATGRFHFALQEGGCLFLGNAETADQPTGLFRTVSDTARLYHRVGPTRHHLLNGSAIPGLRSVSTHALAPPAPALSPGRAGELARRALLDRYAPPAVLVDAGGHILYVHGETGDYLRPPAGEPTLHVAAMAREGLVTKLRNALPEAAAGRIDASFTAQVRHDAAARPVTVRLMPMNANGAAPGMVLVAFEPLSAAPGGGAPAPHGSNTIDTVYLEDELRLTRAELQGSIERLERLNEELKAANEEITSMNEELQSINEELETSKRELQSFNVELQSINQQLQRKITELEEVGNDLSNLLSGTDIATVFLDTQFRITWFSPATRQLLDLVSSDIGRPMRHFSRKFDDPHLLDAAETVLATLRPVEAEICSDDERWFLRRILPYRTQDNRIAGVVMTFIDITERKLAHDALDEARIYAEAIIDTARHPLTVLDAELCVRSANRAFFGLFQTTPERIKNRPLFALCNSESEAEELRALLQDVVPLDRKVQDCKIVWGGPARRIMLINARRLLWNGGRENLLLIAFEDITERENTARHHETLISELNHRVKNVLSTVQAIMSQTARRSNSLDDFCVAFEGRLRALSGAHDLVLQKRWLGTDIRQIVEQTLAPYRVDGNDRMAVSGEPVTVSPRIGVGLAMILHELATNAAKYGALSVAGGRLEVAWQPRPTGVGQVIRLEWIESGGPRVVEPERRGFGTKLIERTAKQELEGEAWLAYLEQGLRCELTFPWVVPNQANEGSKP